MTAQHVRIAIVGAGFSGLGMAIRLKRDGVDDFVILERAADVGGTWQRQHLPGLPLRRPVAPLLVLVRAQPGLVQHLLRRSRRSATYLRRLRDRFGSAAATCAPASSRGATGTRTQARWQLDDHRRAVHGDVADHRAWGR